VKFFFHFFPRVEDVSTNLDKRSMIRLRVRSLSDASTVRCELAPGSTPQQLRQVLDLDPEAQLSLDKKVRTERREKSGRGMRRRFSIVLS
jgi:hypothetical protein